MRPSEGGERREIMRERRDKRGIFEKIVQV